ncbi:MAG: thiol:disulfide interchange protein [Caulobacterales bacterium 32-69-10]|nr:MAG: thiol:disulfide interchange protein [Caulobacterales bacterium 32-69-10]
MRHTLVRALAAALLVAVGASSANSAPAKTEHLEVELAPQTSAAVPGSTIYIALKQKIAPGWHTYWRNPGDAGQATQITWELPPGWTAGEIVWPTPQRFVTGPLMNYVYANEVYLPVPVAVPADAKPGQTVNIKAKADFLVCAEICIPESTDLSLDLPISAGAAPLNPTFGDAIAKTLAAAPKAEGIPAVFSFDGTAVKLAVTGPLVAGADVRNAYFYPDDGASLEHVKVQKAERGPDGLTLTLAPGQAFMEGKTPAEMIGVLALDEAAYVIEAQPGPLPAGAAGLTPALATTNPDGTALAGAAAGEASAAGGAGMGLLTAAAFAFIGGLILNLMPCVFPVLSLKASALARHAEHPGSARAEGLAFLVGVVATFLILAGLLLAARAAGQAVGWGFQLQSPIVVAGLALLMLLVGLNLSGLFEIGTSVQGAGSGLTTKRGLAGAFFTGALAVVVAAPCTAPFMAGAIGWAATQPPAAALLVFLFLGLGLAAPFTALSFAPGLFKKLPKPGGWMEGFRKVLAFPMYGAAAWLAWVFAVQAGPNALPFLFAAAILVAFAAWTFGVGQRADKPGLPRGAAAVAMVLALPLLWVGAQMSAPALAASTETAETGPGIPTEPWSPERVAALQAEGRPVFVDFTAAWCVTCQVNERTSLAGKRVADAFAKTGAVYLKADWTNRNDQIAKELASHGRSGVPLYLVYGKAGEPAVLPQLLTEGVVSAALEKAKGA